MATQKDTSVKDEQSWPELYFGLVGPVGTDLAKLERLLKKEGADPDNYLKYRLTHCLISDN
ncbi:MAG: hypothetical protein HQ494_08530 [Rhodospirillales bacterium]|nr:hypothetical protein [Rhodospirillales bacterium]